MSNGLGAGFFAITLLAVLAGLALLVVLSTGVSWVWYRRAGRVPAPLRYLLVAVGVGVLGVAGFGVLVLFDEAPAVAGLFALLVVVPLLVAGGYLERTTGLGRLDVAATTVMAWGLPFLLGVVVVFGVTTGLSSAFDLAPAEFRRLGVAWAGAAVGGITVVLAMIPLGTRLGAVVRPVETGERA